MFIVPLSGLSSAGEAAKISGEKHPVTEAGKTSEAFFDIFSEALADAEKADAVAKQDSYDLAAGNVEDVAQVMLNSLQATTTLEVATQLTGRAVSAYKEIMQMQV